MSVGNRYIEFHSSGIKLYDPFLDYWFMNGGVNIFGVPVSPVVKEDVKIDDYHTTVDVQYFENVILEWHTDHIQVRKCGLIAWERKQQPDRELAKLKSAFTVNP